MFADGIAEVAKAAESDKDATEKAKKNADEAD